MNLASGVTLIKRPACPLCDSGDSTTLVDIAYAVDPIRRYLVEFYEGRLDPDLLGAARFQVDRCDRCGLVFQRWVPDDEFLTMLYRPGGIAAPFTTTSATLETSIVYAHQVEQVLHYFQESPHDIDVLDFGAGTGRWLKMASAFGCRTTGAELTLPNLDLISEAHHQAITTDSLPAGAFHFINSEQVFEHLVDPVQTVNRLANALRPGGVVRLAVPDGSNIQENLTDGDWLAPKGSTESLNAIAPLEHLNCFSPRSLTRLARDAGLEPFQFPLRSEIRLSGRIRFVAGAALRGIRYRPTTAQHFMRTLH